MLFHRHHPHRAGSRRSATALLVLAATVVATVLSIAAPASPAGAAPAPPPIQVKIDNAVNLALTQLIERPECNALLTNNLFTLQARGVLASATNSFRDDPPPGVPASAFASVPVGGGFGQDIEFYRNFDRIGPSRNLNFQGRVEPPLNDFDVIRAVAVLHEVGHLTGVEADHRPVVAENGQTISRDRAEGLYNTRIINTCFAPRYLIAGASCQQVFNPGAYGSTYTTVDCFASCRADSGPVTVAWTSPLQSTITTDTSNGGCTSFRRSLCPPSIGFVPGTLTRLLYPSVDITLDVTDVTGHTSTDTFQVQCYDFNFG